MTEMSMELPPLPSEDVHRTIAVDYNKEEYTEFNFVVFRDRLRNQAAVYLTLGVITIALGFFVPGESAFSSRTILLLLGTVILLSPLIQRESVRAMCKRIFDSPNNWLLIKRATILDSNGIRTEGHDGSYSFTPWSSVSSISEGKVAAYFILSSHQGLIIPRRAFPDERSYSEFVRFAKVQLLQKA